MRRRKKSETTQQHSTPQRIIAALLATHHHGLSLAASFSNQCLIIFLIPFSIILICVRIFVPIIVLYGFYHRIDLVSSFTMPNEERTVNKQLASHHSRQLNSCAYQIVCRDDDQMREVKVKRHQTSQKIHEQNRHDNI